MQPGLRRRSRRPVWRSRGGFPPFGASKVLGKRRVSDVEEAPELGEIRAHPQAWNTGSTVLTSPEWPADAAGRLRMKQEGDDAKAEGALQRKQQRKTGVVDLRRAIPTADLRDDDEAPEVLRAERDGENQGQFSTSREAPGSTPRSSQVSSGTLRRFGMAGAVARSTRRLPGFWLPTRRWPGRARGSAIPLATVLPGVAGTEWGTNVQLLFI
jgi:hypothetical protein